jgi:hypothetical protein
MKTTETLPPSGVTAMAGFITLAPGQYTAILNGKFVGTGIGLVEVYNLK